MSRFQAEGIFAATVTPFTADGATVDEEGIRRLVERLIRARVAGLVTCGSTGEFPHLTSPERERVLEVTVAAAAGRVPVVAHTGALTTSETVALSVHAAGVGADAVMVVPPFYDPLTWEELVTHFRAVATAVDVPLVLYNIPGVTGVRLTPAQIVDLARLTGFRYVKDTSGDASALTELVERYDTHLAVFNGWDSLSLIGFLVGLRGAIWGAANVVPDLCVELFDHAVGEGDVEGARAIWRRLWPVISFFESHPYTPSIKAGCELIGEAAGPPRLPFLPLEHTAVAELRSLLEAAGVQMAVGAS